MEKFDREQALKDLMSAGFSLQQSELLMEPWQKLVKGEYHINRDLKVFDTLTFFNKMCSAGYTEEQARALINIAKTAIGNALQLETGGTYVRI